MASQNPPCAEEIPGSRTNEIEWPISLNADKNINWSQPTTPQKPETAKGNHLQVKYDLDSSLLGHLRGVKPGRPLDKKACSRTTLWRRAKEKRP
jgi:hypothetical protein